MTSEIKDLARRAQTLNSYFGTRATLLDVEKNRVEEASKVNWSASSWTCQVVIELDDDDDDVVPNDVPAERLQVIVINLDNEETGDQRCFNPYQDVVQNKPAGEFQDTAEDPLLDEHVRDGLHECDHSFLLKDDIGYVC